MSKNSIINNSIFGIYSKRENLITSSLLFTLQEGKINTVKSVFQLERKVRLDDVEIQVTKQFQKRRMIFDGLLSFTDNSKLIIECKVGRNKIGEEQLAQYYKYSLAFNYSLCYITQDAERPKILCESTYQSVLWISWKDVMDNLRKMKSSRKILTFYITEFEKQLTYFNMLK